MRAHFPQKLDIVEIPQPLGIIHHDGLALAKIQEPADLFAELSDVVIDGLRRHHLAHIAFARRIADHARAAAQQHDGPVPRPLHMRHCHQRHKVPHMQAVCRRVEANIEGNFLFGQKLFQALMRHLLDKPSLLKHFKCIFHFY